MNTNKKALSIAFDDKLLSVLKPNGKAKLSKSDAFIDIIRRIRTSAISEESVDNNSSDDLKQAQKVTAEKINNPPVNVTAGNLQDLFNQKKYSHQHNTVSSQNFGSQQNRIAQQRQDPQQSDVVKDQSASKLSPLQQTTPTQCVINYTHLAHDWQWDRATVRSFLENLEQAGVILLETNGKKITLYV